MPDSMQTLHNVGLSIVIVYYNTRGLLHDCLRSIFENLPPTSVQVIVVDNASSDRSAEMVKANYPQVDLISSQINLGFARGNNIGFQQTTYDLIMVLNPDTLVRPGA